MITNEKAALAFVREAMRAAFPCDGGDPRVSALTFVRMALGGSRGSCVSSVTAASDWDVLVDVSGLDRLVYLTVEDALSAAGFRRDLDEQTQITDYAGSPFTSWRHPNGVNALVITSADSFDKTKVAVEVIRALNLTRREDRIAVNQIIRDGRAGDEVCDVTNVGELIGQNLRQCAENVRLNDVITALTGQRDRQYEENVALIAKLAALEERIRRVLREPVHAGQYLGWGAHCDASEYRRGPRRGARRRVASN